MMHAFAVRHRTTGRFLPQSFVYGSTYWDPNEESPGQPRLFHSERAARAFIVAWARGWAKTYDKESSTIEYEDQGRSRDELEVVKFQLVEETA